MEIISDALRQAFVPSRDYENLRRPLATACAAVIGATSAAAAVVSVAIVFPREPLRRPFCRDRRVQEALQLNLNISRDPDPFRYRGAFYLTDEEVAQYFWMVVFLPSAVLFLVSAVYLLAGMAVAYSAPRRHFCLRVVENNYCASRRGGVRCLSILNGVIAVVFGLMALFLGSSILTLGSKCSVPLFWCYEIASWGLVTLYGGTAFFLRRKAAMTLDEGEFGGRRLGLEMLESTLEVTPEMERRVNEGFKSWMGSSLLSSDEEDGSADYLEEGHTMLTRSGQ